MLSLSEDENVYVDGKALSNAEISELIGEVYKEMAADGVAPKNLYVNTLFAFKINTYLDPEAQNNLAKNIRNLC